MKKITKPTYLEHALYHETFINLVKDNESVLNQLKANAKSFEKLILSLTEKQLTTPYAAGKWTIKDIIMHLIDLERVFLYRAMRFARKDKTPLPFFEENDFAEEANASAIATKNLLKEYKATRQAFIAFLNNLNSSTLKNTGFASNTSTSVRACAWIVCGHEIHHINVIKERYL